MSYRNKALMFWDKYHIVVIITLITLLALALRLVFINVPLWYDEACSHLVAKNSLPFGIDQFLLEKDLQHMPLYFYILNIWMSIFGESDISIRVLSLIFGLATVPLSYIVASKLHSKEIGILASIFVAVNAFLVLYSTEARMYSMVTFLALLSVNYLIDYNKNSDRKSLIKLSVVNILIPYTLTGAIAFNIAQLASYLAYLAFSKKDKTQLKDFVISQLISLVFLIPYFMILSVYIKVRGEFIVSHITPFMFVNFIEVVRNLLSTSLGKIYWAGYDAYFVNFAFFMFVIVPLCYLIVAIAKSLKENEKLTKVIFSIILLVFVFNIACAMSKIIIFSPRYVIYIAPLLLILAAIGISKLKPLHMFIFICFYAGASVYNIVGDKNIKAMKTDALKSSAKYAQEHKFTKDDMVLMPFGSSVGYRYISWDNAPRIFEFEAIQELRKPENSKVYDPTQTEALKKDPIKTIQQIVLNDNVISANFYNYIKSNINDKVEKGNRVLLVIYGPDIDATISPRQYKELFKDAENVKKDTIGALFPKFMNDLQWIISQDFKLLSIERDNSNVYVLFEKK